MTDPAPASVPIRPDGLQLDENRAFQQRFWKLQRFAWIGYLLIILTALSGLTGRSGPFATGHTLVGGAQVTWPRISRRGVPETITVIFPPPATAPELILGQDLTTLFQIESILPHPAMESGGQPLRFAFFPDPGQPYSIAVSIRAQSAGLTRYAIGTGDARTTLTTLVLP